MTATHGKLLAAAATLAMLAACGDEAGDTMPADGPQIPEGAIPVGDDVFMAPAGLDPGGCAQFTMWSPTKAVTMVIQYRDSAGGFTPDRDKADCPP